MKFSFFFTRDEHIVYGMLSFIRVSPRLPGRLPRRASPRTPWKPKEHHWTQAM